MARTIAIELEVNGVKESVKTIGELETAIEQLTEELKNTDIGTEKFNQLTNFCSLILLSSQVGAPKCWSEAKYMIELLLKLSCD